MQSHRRHFIVIMIGILLPFIQVLSVMILKVIFHECILHTYSSKVLLKK